MMNISKQITLLAVLFLSVVFRNSSAQSVISRSNFGFNDSRHYFAGSEQRRDSIMVGIPSMDSSQTFDFRSIYFDQTCPGYWAEDTLADRAKQVFSGSTEIDAQIQFDGTGLDTIRTYYSSTTSNNSDTLWYHGFEDQMGESIICSGPLPLLVFPLQLGSRWTDTIPAVVDKKKEMISATGMVDGYGTMLLSSGTFPVLRVLVTLDFKEYREYRYYFISSTPYISACLVALHTANPATPRQMITHASYSGPVSRYDHCVYPNLICSFPLGTLQFAIGSTDTLPLRCMNTGDTTAIIDSLSLLAGSPEVFLGSPLVGTNIIAGDSIFLPVFYRPASSDQLINSLLFIYYNGLSTGESFTVEGAASDVRSSLRSQNTFSVYPSPAKTSVSFVSPKSGGHVRILDMLGREVLRGIIPASGTLTLDVSSLPPGLYFISDGTTNTKFVKK